MRYVLLKLLPLVLCLFVIAACEGETPMPKQAVKAPLDQQVYTIPEVSSADFDTLDPALVHDAASIRAVQMIFTGLVQLDDQLKVHAQIARSWEVGSDGVSWTFHLRPNLKFSDGTPLTAADVAYSIDRALQPATRSTTAPLYLSLIKDADRLLAGKIPSLIGSSLLVRDPQTLVILTKKKAAYFPMLLTMPCSYVVEKRLITKYGNRFTDHLNEGGGAGPFKVAQYTHRVRIEFVPNAHYYNAAPQLQKVSIVFYHSADDAYRDYVNHRVDTTGVPLSTFSTDKKRKDFVQVPQAWINYYAMNYLTKPFNNIHMRQAFALAIDKTALAHNVWKDTVLPTNHLVPQGIQGYNAQLTGPDGTQNLNGNAQKARELFQQALREEGWVNASQVPQITLTYAAGVPGFEQEVAALVQTWQKVLNVTVATNPVEYNTLLDKVTASTSNANGLQLWGLSWVGEYPDPYNWLSLQFGRGSPNNNMNYGQTAQQLAVQQQMDEADASLNETTRLQIYQRIEQQLVNDVAWLPVEQMTAVFLRSPAIVGIVDNAQGIIPPDDWAKIYRVQIQS
ncbi:MAG: peptide ABC transporter substrate-binding protein [Ktedonobacteraceae bacterium]|nr:peptide ABC transporter substrate-binding protein [Ktedonobacteraceae bacterium]